MNAAAQLEAELRRADRDGLILLAGELARLNAMVTVRLQERQEDEMVDVIEAIRLTGLSRQTLYRKPLPFRRPGRPVRFSRRRIEEWQRQQEETA
jgi:predicted DNA-binding transcriptional regulator AlpA